MVTFVTVALFLLVGVVVAALCLAALFAFLFGCLGTAPLSLATVEAVRAQVRTARGEVLTAAAPTLCLGEHRRWTWFRGPLDRNNRARQKSQTYSTGTKLACKDTYRDERWGMRSPASSLVESSTLFLDKALVAVTLEHGLSLGATALTPAPRTILKARLGCVSGLDNSGGGHYTNKNSQKSHTCYST